MLSRLDQLVEHARGRGPVPLAVAVAQDEGVIEAVRRATSLGLVRATLFGDEGAIRSIAGASGLAPGTTVVHEPAADRAALLAVASVHRGESAVLMKGMINSSDFLRAALNPDCGLRSGNLLSHLAVFEIPGVGRLAFHTDGGMVVAPGLEEKKGILRNALSALTALGIARPNVAVLSANEQVNPKVPATTDARALVELAAAGGLSDCVIEGPIAMDVAASAEAAAHKGIRSAIAGQVDLFLLPNIEAGNLVGKTLLYYAHARMAGVVLGATHPMVLVSRADDADAKVHSIALAALVAAPPAAR